MRTAVNLDLTSTGRTSRAPMSVIAKNARFWRPIFFVSLLSSAFGQTTPPATLPGSSPSSQIRFEEITAKSGLNYVTATANTDRKNQPQTMVAGVALFDYDGDGYLDVYLVGEGSLWASVIQISGAKGLTAG